MLQQGQAHCQASSPSSSRDSAALEFPHARRPAWVGYVGRWVSVATSHYSGSSEESYAFPTSHLKVKSQEVIDCLWRRGAQGSSQKRV